MISLLPVPGGFFTLANRCLTPSLVCIQENHANSQGFACGWSYWFSQVMAFTAQLVASSTIISLWLPNTPKEVWILVISIACILFNNFRVRRYGEVEYWLTVVKVCTVVGIILAGIILPMNASPNQRLLGTDLAGNPVPCSQTASNYTCVAAPGFNCIILPKT
jgi:amino acid permease